MTVCGVHHHQVDAGIDQAFAARITGFAYRGRSGNAQPPLLVLASTRIRHRFFNIFDRDEADAAIAAVDYKELLDAMLMQEALGFVLPDTFAHRDEALLGHQLGDFLTLIGGKPHIAVGENAHQLSRAPVAAALNNRNAGNVMLLHQYQRISERRFGMDRNRVHHHAGFVFLHLPHLGGLCFGIEIAMENADAAGLRHGDRHKRFGHRIHRRGDDRDIEPNVRSNAGADIHLRRHHVGKPRLQ